MSNYKRVRVAGACYFFTVNLHDRRQDLLVRHINLLRDAVRIAKFRHPFYINAWAVLPDHMHCIWTLPQGDADFSLRWKVIKTGFSKRLPPIEPRTDSRQFRRERGIWQRRFWEHLIQDEQDFQHHFDYIHGNPVKHGYVQQVKDWPYSSFHRAVAQGIYPKNWAQPFQAT